VGGVEVAASGDSGAGEAPERGLKRVVAGIRDLRCVALALDEGYERAVRRCGCLLEIGVKEVLHARKRLAAARFPAGGEVAERVDV